MVVIISEDYLNEMNVKLEVRNPVEKLEVIFKIWFTDWSMESDLQDEELSFSN